MTNTSEDWTVVGTFEDVTSADLACEAGRGGGFRVERRSPLEVVVYPGTHDQHIGEVQGILRACGARECALATAQPGAGAASRDVRRSGGASRKHRGKEPVEAPDGARVELVEEDLRSRKRPVQTGEVTIRREWSAKRAPSKCPSVAKTWSSNATRLSASHSTPSTRVQAIRSWPS